MKIGDIARGRDIGYKSHSRSSYMWTACPICGKERWVAMLKGVPMYFKCNKCSKNPQKGELNHCWKGGKWLGQGYTMIWVDKDNYFSAMRNKHGYIPEHRLVMAKHLNRCLKSFELVHHINSIKTDNRIENLIIVTQLQHNQLEKYIMQLWVNEHPDIARKVIEQFIKGVNNETDKSL